MRLDSARRLWPFWAGCLLALIVPTVAWAQDELPPGAAAAAGGAALLINCVSLILTIITIVGMWKLFVKADKPGWAAIVPIYNVIVLLEIVGRPLWWIILLLIPLVNLVILIMVTVDLAKSFGQGVGYAIGLLLLPFIFYPMLGFGDATYQGPVAATV